MEITRVDCICRNQGIKYLQYHQDSCREETHAQTDPFSALCAPKNWLVTVFVSEAV